MWYMYVGYVYEEGLVLVNLSRADQGSPKVGCIYIYIYVGPYMYEEGSVFNKQRLSRADPRTWQIRMIYAIFIHPKYP